MRKMILRADDVGYTDICNIGSFHAIDGGMITSADVMLDGFGIADALTRLKGMPWLSIGWHVHMWCIPALDPSELPTLVERSGPFAGRFREDIWDAADVDEAEAKKELRAELSRFIHTIGRCPDTGEVRNTDKPFGAALKQVFDENGIPYGFATREASSEVALAKIRKAKAAGEPWAQFYRTDAQGRRDCDPRWADRKILTLDFLLPYMDLYTDSVTEIEETYDPVLYYTEDRAHILDYPEDVITEQSWHPGYVDYIVYRTGERMKRARARQFIAGRVQDVEAMRDPRLAAWIRDHEIELVNYRDALYGTRDFQNHLREVRSPLAVDLW